MSTEPSPAVLENIALNELLIGERFRQDYGEMEDLVESVKDKGILTPITVRRLTNPPTGFSECKFELMAGGRRTVAAKSAGLTHIPALIRDLEGDLDLREVELFENVFRKDMEWHEKVKLVDHVQKLWSEKHADTPWKWSQRKCAKMLGISHTHLGRQIELAKALEVMPELSEAKDEAEARKKLKNLQERFVVQQELKKHKEEIKRGGLKLVQRGDGAYQIGDAFEGMEQLLDLRKRKLGGGVIQLVEVDPPYAIDLVDTKRRKYSDDADISEYHEVDRKEYNKFLTRLCQLCFDVAQDDAWLVFWFGPSWFTDVKIAIARAGWTIDDIPCIWNKGYGQTSAPNYKLARTYEPFFVARKGKAAVRNKGRSNVFNYAPVPSQSKYHPTQRPLELMEDILTTFGTANTGVLSPFLGSGTTIRAAFRKNMSAFGWDLSEEYKKRFLIELAKDEDEANGEPDF